VFTDQIKEIFSSKGLLSSSEGFEYRQQQQQMALDVAQQLQSGSHQIIEAPTGTGKSYAYLVPSIIFAKENKRKAIISTRTINLQEQLSKKDIPFIKDLLGIDFKFEILKGRRNYICSNRLNAALLKKSSLFMDDEQELLHKIYDFVQKNDRGELQDLDFLSKDRAFNSVWESIYAEEGICTSRSCMPPGGYGSGANAASCFFQRAKQRVKEADLVIVNHALLFTLFGISSMNQPGFIFADDFVIFDECHAIERVAAENISESVSREQIRYWLNRMYNPRSKKGFYSNSSYPSIHRLVKKLIDENDFFFGEIQRFVRENYKSKAASSEVRMLEPVNTDLSFTEVLDELIKEIKRTAQTAGNTNEENEIKNFGLKFLFFKENIRNFMLQRKEQHVYWVEFSGKARKNISLKFSPIDMAEFFRTNVFNENRLCLMTSATLTIGDSMEFFQSSIGAENIKTCVLDSPFDLNEQIEVHINESMPEPSQKNSAAYGDAFSDSPYETVLKEKVYEYILKTGGGVLVLCTNFKVMNKLSYSLNEKLAGSGIKVFTQGEGLTSNNLLKSFKDDTNSVLLGVDSFWMGVDVPGESLRNVIITRLPFETPDQPIVEAKMELIQANGGNPFYNYSLPSAILKFRQGMGRLIRNKTDKGIIVILDRRILTARYGRYFIEALPNRDFIKD
jgi:ATP-dependent DNA helicase DinG